MDLVKILGCFRKYFKFKYDGNQHLY